MGYRGFPVFSQWQTPSGACCFKMHKFWGRRACGIACLQAVLLHLRGVRAPLVELAEEVLSVGGYDVQKERVPGLIYAPFAAYLADRWSIRATVAAPLPISELVSWLERDSLAIASVHHSIRDAPKWPLRTGGHLVTVWRHSEGRLSFMNPSEVEELRQRARLRVEMFDRYYARRAVLIHPA